MRSHARAFVLVVAVALGCVLIPLHAQQQPSRAAAPPSPPLSETIPLDPAITAGKFDNGLHYFIRTTKRPEKRAELRLVVNVGSIVEDDNPRGLAHMLEHMAFNGTQHFPKQEIVTFLESLGMRFGPSVNAYTSFDETVYMLQGNALPVDLPSLHAAADRSHGVLRAPGTVEAGDAAPGGEPSLRVFRDAHIGASAGPPARPKADRRAARSMESRQVGRLLQGSLRGCE